MPSTKARAKKTSEVHPKRNPPPDGVPPQRTIVEHFTHSKQGIRDDSALELIASSPNKRLKLHHYSGILPSSKGNTGQVKTIGDMYSFSANKRSIPSERIDLTSSPDASPLRSTSKDSVPPASFTPSTGPKRLVIKNKKRPSGPNPEQYYTGVWEKLEVALAAIFVDENLPHSKETLYNEVMILCRQGKANALLVALGKEFSNHVEGNLKTTLHQAANTETSQQFLRSVVAAWDTWLKQLGSVQAIFFFLDRSYVLQHRLPSITAMGTQRFRASILEDEGLQAQAMRGICDLILAERNRQSASTAAKLIQQVVQMYTRLEIYGEYLEPKILSESQQYYSRWTEQTVASTDLEGYLEMCDRQIRQELEQAASWALDPTTIKELEMYLEDILIEGKKDRLLDADGVAKLLDQNKVASLQQEYILLQRRGFGSELKIPFEKYIRAKGSGIVFDEAREQEMVSRLLEFKRQLDGVWENAFNKNVDLGHTLREAFETFINQSKRSNMNWGTDNPKPGEMIAKHVDRVLKGGSKALRASGITGNDALNSLEIDQDASEEDEDVEIGKQLDQVLDLFRFVHGKAVFEAFYKRDLARRLLLGRSASSDAEKSMLTRLKSGTFASF